MKNYSTKALHYAIHSVNNNTYRSFLKDINSFKSYQIVALQETLNELNHIKNYPIKNVAKLSYQEFSKSFKVSNYSDWKNQIEEQMETKKAIICSHTERYQPTSGSTHQIKWIPYNKLFLKQINRAASFWLSSLYEKHPSIKNGKHYWSLSWLPEAMRQKVQVNDNQLFPWAKRQLMKNVMAVNDDIINLPKMEQSQIATLVQLVCEENLSLISIWSPSFLLALLEKLESEKELLSKISKDGKWEQIPNFKFKTRPNIDKILEKYEGKELFQKIWPKLELISAWSTGNSKNYFEQLKSLFPNVESQGKGLWATEGVVTIPYQNEYLLAYKSHFYEFLDLETEKVLLPWEIKKDMLVSPIITTGNGLTRYHIEDILKVNGFVGECPTLEFISRKNTVDLVGEKLDFTTASKIISSFSKNNDCVCFIAQKKQDKAIYLLLTSNKESLNESFTNKLDEKLRENFHYNLAIESNQIMRSKVLYHPNPVQLYYKLCSQKGMIEGNIKIDPIIVIDEKINLEEEL